MECFFDGWKKTFNYKGRTTRREFWLFIITNVVIVLLVAGISYYGLVYLIADHTSRGGMMMVWAWYIYFPLRALAPIILLLPVISLGIRRMHDIGRSGWWFGVAMLINLVVLPLILTGVYWLTVSLAVTVGVLQAVNVISLVLTCLAALYPIVLCCKPSKPDVSAVS